MSQISKFLRLAKGNVLMFWCPGCRQAHQIKINERVLVPGYVGEDGEWVPDFVSQPPSGGPQPWRWNGDVIKPTFTPSILVTQDVGEPPVTPENLEQWKIAPWEQLTVKKICHSVITNGRIKFLNDCTHNLAGQTVDLPNWPSRGDTHEGAE